MGASLVVAYLHLVVAIFLVGYVLYWAIMVVSLSRTFSPHERARLLEIANKSRWPHVAVPWQMRLPLPFVGWGLVLLLLVSGLFLLPGYGFGALLTLKIVLFAAFVVIHAVLTRRPVPSFIFANFALALVIVVLSGLLLRA